ncbi:hypothetical protein D9757_012233 [Collybiopsis confluens]|uniref:JmjC domain-containing protein n=1 Tax=Collybiopsis confluens TaxID=2823264 RepID=A0A8H5G7U4_9AGAR|nr:hypothetical protein D9757_012233 [Collybiopsis confluens]
MQEVVQSGRKVANCLEIPLLPSTVQYPSGLCTQDVAEAETGHPISHVGKTWGLFASSHALHTSHIDSDGRGTFIQVKVGVKYWIVAVPMSDTDLGQLEAFGEGYDVDMTNSQSWKIYGILLWPGDWLVFPPCTPHFVLTLEAAICHGGHFVSSQTLVWTNYAILQTFVASDLLTNTIDFNAPEGLRLIVQYWSNLIVDNEEDYLEMLKKHAWQISSNLEVFLMYASIERTVPTPHNQGLDIEDWLFRHFHLVLVSSSESSEASDGLETAERLPTLAVRYFAQQTQALLYHKFTTTEQGIHGEDQCITPNAVKHAIEAELKDDTEFMTQWPEILKAEGSVEDWVLECQKKGIMHLYVWPESPAGGEYEVVQDE